MFAWLVAAALGAALALATYRGGAVRGARAWAMRALRAAALAVAFAIVLGAPAGRGRAPRPLVVLDASSSWARGGDTAAWRAARAAAAAAGADTLWLAGDSLRAGPLPAVPADLATRLAPAAERARASGRPLVLITDGEADDAPSLGALPPGSRVVVPARGGPAVDAAVTGLEAPRRAVAGDTVPVRVTVAAGAAPVPRATLALLLGGRAAASAVLEPLAAGEERVVEFRVRAPEREGTVVLAAAVRAEGDREPRDDSAAVALEVARAAGVVFVSSAPDEEMRELVPVLRGALALPAEGYYRVARGQWRREGTLAAVSESEVRRALREAPVAILHGDTALFGAPRAAAGGALLLVPSGGAIEGEWYATGAPASPLAGALAGAPWDSLPPLAVPERAPEGAWTGLTVARARRYEARAAVAGSDAGRRVAIVGAFGLWRWKFRGGAPAAVYDALWGGILDWLAAERRDPRAVTVDAALVRAGEMVRWRRGAGADSLVTVALRRVGAATADTLRLHFAAGAATAESAPLAPGVYEARAAGGASLLVVNESREWQPRRPALAAGVVAGEPPRGGAPSLRMNGWAYLLVIAALCAEWILRRGAGLR